MAVHLYFVNTGADKQFWANHPKDLNQIYGIFTGHFVHADWKHLVNNMLSLVVLGAGISLFYKRVVWQLFLGIALISGLWVWVFARTNYHLGASGLVYGFAAFLFLSGVLKKYPQMYALSLLVIFLYGSLIWGIFPIDHKISWEGHLMGMLSGFLMAIYYKNEGPQRPKYSWELEPEEEISEEEELLIRLATSKEGQAHSNDAVSENEEDSSVKIVYSIKNKEDKSKN